MKSNTIIIVILGLVAVSILFIFGYISKGSSSASIQGISGLNSSSDNFLTVSENVYNFGLISMKNGDVTKEFTITNSTDEDINIIRLETSCMCTRAYLVLSDGTARGPFGMAGMGGITTTNEIIKASESRILRVVYDPNAHGPAGVGKIDRFITLKDSKQRTQIFEIKAIVTP